MKKQKKKNPTKKTSPQITVFTDYSGSISDKQMQEFLIEIKRVTKSSKKAL